MPPRFIPTAGYSLSRSEFPCSPDSSSASRQRFASHAIESSGRVERRVAQHHRRKRPPSDCEARSWLWKWRSLLVLLVSAGLLIRSLVRLQERESRDSILTTCWRRMSIFPGQKYTNAKQDQFARELMSKLRALPGVQSAAGVFPLPMSGAEMRTSVEIEGRPVAKSDEAHSTVFSVTPDYFRTMKIALLQGRDFTRAGRSGHNSGRDRQRITRPPVFPGRKSDRQTHPSREFPWTTSLRACGRSSAWWPT